VWPPPSHDEPIKLSDSFPNGELPNEVRKVLRQIGMNDVGGSGSIEKKSADRESAASSSTTTGGAVVDETQQQRQQQARRPQRADDDGRRRRPREWRKMLPRAIARILRRAAANEEEMAFLSPDDGITTASSSSSRSRSRLSNAPPTSSSSTAVATSMDKTPAVLALTLLGLGYTRPLDWLIVTFLSGYFVLLMKASLVRRADGITPTLPSLPPTGHVPVLVSNPLGQSFAYSMLYYRWLKWGVILGLLGPVLAGMYCSLVLADRAGATLALRPLFFLSCQAMTEAAGRRAMAPLPIRILVPIAYNTVRLGYLWNWAFAAAATTTTTSVAAATSNAGATAMILRLLAVSNLAYWGVNLFAFLIPVAAMRYLRAHVIGVELESATMRPGMEESVGMLPLS